MGDEVIAFMENLEIRVKEEFGDKATPEFINLLRLGKAAYEHGYHSFISEEKVLEWVEMLYKAGQEQRSISRGEKHGMILINTSDVINSASYLSLFGKRKGYLSN